MWSANRNATAVPCASCSRSRAALRALGPGPGRGQRVAMAWRRPCRGLRPPRALDEDRARRVAWQHVVGELDADWLGEPVPEAGWPRPRTGCGRHRAGRRPAPTRPGGVARGLVVGDDRYQPPAMVERFRRQRGLSHLIGRVRGECPLGLAVMEPISAPTSHRPDVVLDLRRQRRRGLRAQPEPRTALPRLRRRLHGPRRSRALWRAWLRRAMA